jgi:hypothetical protein
MIILVNNTPILDFVKKNKILNIYRTWWKKSNIKEACNNGQPVFFFGQIEQPLIEEKIFIRD